MRPVHADRVVIDPRTRDHTYRGTNGTEAIRRPDGRVSMVRTRDMTIRHDANGARRVVVQRPDGRVIVARGSGYGYVQKPFVARNHSYVQRTYLAGNVRHVSVYRPYSYRGLTLNLYQPNRYYHSSFYGWAYSPWARPVSYGWGWGGTPWYGHYGRYFTPYSVYSSPALWLTDFLIATTLEEAYQERMAARLAFAPLPPNQAPLSPSVKQAIAIEVQRQLETERLMAQNPAYAQAAADGLPPTFAENRPHVFVVDSSIDVADLSAGGAPCPLSDGDVIQTPGAPNTNSVNAVVLASTAMDCRAGSAVSVPITDLIEMQNHMRQTLDTGLEELRRRQGQGGLPVIPASAAVAPVAADFAASIPPPDAASANEIQTELQQATTAEQQVVSEAWAPEPAGQPGPADQPTSGGPTTIALGQSIAQVTDMLGNPQRVVDLGPKKILFYKDMKITFTDGVVTNVE